MRRLTHGLLIATLTCGTLPGTGNAQSSTKTGTADASSATERAVGLAESGHCREALPILKKFAPLTPDKQLKIKGGLAAVRCGLTLDQVDDVTHALQWLTREFPSDPDVLYVATHAYSDLSSRFALQLGRAAPLSHQARELNAESLEAQGKWDEAAAEYKKILQQEPDLPGIHYRLGRIILSMPPTPTMVDDARAEFQAELKIDPNNAGAEYVLGELARQTQDWDDAILHFRRASQLDASFVDAFLGLGYSLKAMGRYAEAVSPLETVVKLQPANPTGHYQLSIAYSKTGRKEEAKREMEIFQQTSAKALKEANGQNQPEQETRSPQ